MKGYKVIRIPAYGENIRIHAYFDLIEDIGTGSRIKYVLSALRYFYRKEKVPAIAKVSAERINKVSAYAESDTITLRYKSKFFAEMGEWIEEDPSFNNTMMNILLQGIEVVKTESEEELTPINYLMMVADDSKIRVYKKLKEEGISTTTVAREVKKPVFPVAEEKKIEEPKPRREITKREKPKKKLSTEQMMANLIAGSFSE